MPQVLSLIDLGQRQWLFVGLYHVHNCQPDPMRPGGFRYSMTLAEGQDELIARIVVYHKRSRASYIWYKPEIVLPIVEVRRERMSIGDFPGYNAVRINHSKLSTITSQQIKSWHGALANIKGVYLITDSSTGKHYVGKASGGDGIWNRWCSYAKNGRGGNVELKQLLREKGNEHMQHFQYAILEIADSHASDEDILRRESYWMDVLKTRDFGLNGKAKPAPILSVPDLVLS